MSDHYHTSIKVSGHNAAAAAKAALEAMLLETEKDGHGTWCSGIWCHDRNEFFSTNDSGEAAIIIVTEVSRNFPEAIFHLFVNGSMAEGFQGPVRIQNANVIDGRTAECSYGGPYDTPEYFAAMAPFKEQPVLKDAVLIRMSPEQLVLASDLERRASEARCTACLIPIEDSDSFLLVAKAELESSMEDALGGPQTPSGAF